MIRCPRCFARNLARWSMPLALFAALQIGPATAGTVEAVLERAGAPAWTGAYLIDAPAESAKPLATLERGTKVQVHEDQFEDGYFKVDRIDASGKLVRSGWVHRKFLRFTKTAADTARATAVAPTAAPTSRLNPDVAAAPQKPAPAKTAPASGSRADETIAQLRQRLEVLEAKNAELMRRVGTLEKTGVVDPSVDFLQRLQKLEMEVRSKDNASLPTVPFPEVPKRAEEPQPDKAPAKIPAMSWILRGW